MHRQQNGTAIQRNWSPYLQNTSASSRGLLKQRKSRCNQFGLTEEERGRVAVPVENKILTMVAPEEVELLVSPPTQTPGNTVLGRALSFQIVEKNKQLTQLCEKAFLPPTSCDCREF